MTASEEVAFESIGQPVEAVADDLLTLCKAIFDDFRDSYLLERLPALIEPDLQVARRGKRWIGFKLAYRRGSDLLYSWLGGVHPAERGRGIATRLMELQHRAAADGGYRFVETRTRASNNAMIILNLRHGFEVCGHEIDRYGVPIVIQRKPL